MSIVLKPSIFAASKSSSSRNTYSPVSYSNARAISLSGTGFPSFLQTLS